MTEQSPLLYGIWLPGRGWLRGTDNRALMFDIREVAGQTAQRVGNRAKVYYIDQSLVDIENVLLETEKEKPFSLYRLLELFGYLPKKKART